MLRLQKLSAPSPSQLLQQVVHALAPACTWRVSTLLAAALRPMSTPWLASLRAEATKTRSIVLVLLVMQTTAAVLLMRYSRTAVRPPGSGPPYLVSSGSGLGSRFRQG